jgi:hypothetical protein
VPRVQVAAAALALLAATVLFGPLPAPAASTNPDPPVTVVVHLVLDLPYALRPAPDSYCLGEHRPARRGPTPVRLIAAYERTLRALGPTEDRFGLGTWTVGASDFADVAYEPVDHVFLTAHLTAVRRTLPALLGRIRRELHQQVALAEIFGVAVPSLGSVRTRVDVRLSFGGADATTLTQIHRIFGDRGRSGASQAALPDGVHVWSGVPPEALGHITGALRGAGLTFTSGVETFVPVDAPACRASRGSGARG